MRVLYFGDVFGKPGREAVKRAISRLRPLHQIDFIILNGENLVHGRGLTPDRANEFFALGVDVITTGNHVWDLKQIVPFLDSSHRIIRPGNYPESARFPTPGKGATIVVSKSQPPLTLGVVQVMGRVFMDALDCPFQTADRLINELRQQSVKAIFVDFHGEATAEKQAFAHYLDGRVSAVVGSHSHVQTADERILPDGTAAITDVGMCGCFDSVIGVKKELSIQKFLTKRPIRYEPAEGPGGFGAVVVDIDGNTGLARSILRLREVIAE